MSARDRCDTVASGIVSPIETPRDGTALDCEEIEIAVVVEVEEGAAGADDLGQQQTTGRAVVVMEVHAALGGHVGEDRRRLTLRLEGRQTAGHRQQDQAERNAPMHPAILPFRRVQRTRPARELDGVEHGPRHSRHVI
jgi:hypothetical protein